MGFRRCRRFGQCRRTERRGNFCPAAGDCGRERTGHGRRSACHRRGRRATSGVCELHDGCPRAVVQAYAREEACEDEFDAINLGYRNANNRIVDDSALDAAIEMVSSVCIASVLWYAGMKSMSAHITFGTLFAFIAYIEDASSPSATCRLGTLYPPVCHGRGAERVFGLDNDEVDAPVRAPSHAAPLVTATDSAFELSGDV